MEFENSSKRDRDALLLAQRKTESCLVSSICGTQAAGTLVAESDLSPAKKKQNEKITQRYPFYTLEELNSANSLNELERTNGASDKNSGDTPLLAALRP